jgi:hypothetical protein
MIGGVSPAPPRPRAADTPLDQRLPGRWRERIFGTEIDPRRWHGAHALGRRRGRNPLTPCPAAGRSPISLHGPWRTALAFACRRTDQLAPASHRARSCNSTACAEQGDPMMTSRVLPLSPSRLRLSRPSRRRRSPLPGKVLRVAPHADLKTLDPVAASIVITRMHGLMIYETLFAWDAQPQSEAADGRKLLDLGRTS